MPGPVFNFGRQTTPPPEPAPIEIGHCWNCGRFVRVKMERYKCAPCACEGGPAINSVPSVNVSDPNDQYIKHWEVYVPSPDCMPWR